MIKQISQFEQKDISFLGDFINSLLNKDFVFFGEEHHDDIALENQLLIIELLDMANSYHQGKKSIQVALEQYFPRHLQVLERFNGGNYCAIKDIPHFGESCFVRHTQPIFELCYKLEINIIPVGDEDMVSSGAMRVLDWNKRIAENLKKFQNSDKLTIPVLGSRHLERINNECNSTPELLRDEGYNPDIAVIIQSNSAGQCQPLYPSVIPQKNPIEQYSLFGKIN